MTPHKALQSLFREAMVWAFDAGDDEFEVRINFVSSAFATRALAADHTSQRDAEDARRWQHTMRCIRMDNFGGYVVHPDDPLDFVGVVSERFAREVDAELARATKGEAP